MSDFQNHKGKAKANRIKQVLPAIEKFEVENAEFMIRVPPKFTETLPWKQLKRGSAAMIDFTAIGAPHLLSADDATS